MINRKILICLIVIAGGAGIILFSLFAFRLGFDNNPNWGPRRLQVLAAGIAIVAFGALYWATPALSRWFETLLKPVLINLSLTRKVKIAASKINVQFHASIINSRLVGNIKRSRWLIWVSKNHVTLWLTLIGCCVLWLYVWTITIGRIETWPSGKNYYWMLTEAFQKGQTFLLVEPSPELLKLANPYDLNQRKGLNYLWDATLYKGKYYLYWGPVPAVLGVLINFITSKRVTDLGLVFAFVIGTALFSVLLLKKLYQDHQLSGWIFWGGVFASVINMPLIWLFTRPSIYEASIAGGQFFMMAGFFLLYLAFQSSVHTRYVALSALAFGLAGGTRINLLPAVIFLAIMILWHVYIVHNQNLRASLSGFSATLIPLVLIACSLCWYNYARFGSIIEFGHRYQLTGLASSNDERDQVSITYFIPNLYSYVFRSLSLSADFPFITVPAIKQNMWPSFIQPPKNYYYAEALAGILFTVPLIGFTAILLLRLFWLAVNGDVSLKRIGSIEEKRFIWFETSLFGYVLIQMGILLVFVSSSMRYLFDVTSVLIVLSSIFVGLHVRSFEEKSWEVKIIAYLWLSMAVLTVIFGFLIGFTGGQNNFLNKNPQLYYQFTKWFSH